MHASSAWSSAPGAVQEVESSCDCVGVATWPRDGAASLAATASGMSVSCVTWSDFIASKHKRHLAHRVCDVGFGLSKQSINKRLLVRRAMALESPNLRPPNSAMAVAFALHATSSSRALRLDTDGELTGTPGFANRNL
jgi:hypothetical protein